MNQDTTSGSSRAPRPVVPLPGPLALDPTTAVAELAAAAGVPVGQVAREMLTAAVAGLPRGMWDEQVLRWLGDRDVSVVATVASLLRRAWLAGIATGRAERVEEHEAVQQMQALLAELGDDLQDAEREAHELQDELRAKDAELGEVLAERHRLAVALRAIEDAAAQCRAGEDTTADTAVSVLLTVIEAALRVPPAEGGPR